MTDFIAGAGRGEVALEEEELAGGEAREPRLCREVRSEGAESAGVGSTPRWKTPARGKTPGAASWMETGGI